MGKKKTNIDKDREDKLSRMVRELVGAVDYYNRNGDDDVEDSQEVSSYVEEAAEHIEYQDVIVTRTVPTDSKEGSVIEVEFANRKFRITVDVV